MGTATRSCRVPRCVSAWRDSSWAMRWNMSKSLLASHGGSIAGVKACTKGCMSVAGQVVLLVPGGGRQHDVGEQRRRGHPEVGRQQQVELPLRRFVAARPRHAVAPRPSLFGHHVGVGAEQVLQEVLVALGGRAEQVGAPQRQRPRPVLGRVDVLDRQLDGPAGQARSRRTRRHLAPRPQSTAASAWSARSSGLASNCG